MQGVSCKLWPRSKNMQTGDKLQTADGVDWGNSQHCKLRCHHWFPHELGGSRKYPSPPNETSLEILRGRGRGVHGKLLFKKGDEPLTKYWKQHSIDLKHKNIPTYVVLKQKSVLLAIDMRLRLALMFLFFIELASVTISRRTMCLWNEVKMI